MTNHPNRSVNQDSLETIFLLDCDAEMNPQRPEEMYYHDAWKGGMYQVLQKGRKQMIVSGSGDKSDYPQPGTQVVVRDDQSRRKLGVWTVVANENHADVANLYAHVINPYTPVRCYK